MHTQHTIHLRYFLWQQLTLRRVLWLPILVLLLSLGVQYPITAQTPLPEFNLVENAVTCGPHICLTTKAPNQKGAAWLPVMQPVEDGFVAEFQWRIDPASQMSADGFAFVIHNAAGPSQA